MIEFVLRPIGHALAFPLVQFFLIAALAFLCRFLLHRIALSRYLFGLAFFWLLLWSQPIPSQLLLQSLERRFDTIKVTDPRWQHADMIAVLACGQYPDDSLPVVSQWPRCSMQRLLHGARMYQHSPRPVLVTGGMILDSPKPFAEHAKQLLIELGVDEKDIVVIPEGENTHQEARAIKALVGNRQLALVTSASHMPRAVRYFDNYSIATIAVPVDHSGTSDIDYKLTVPNAASLQRTHKAFREYLGLAYQYWELQ